MDVADYFTPRPEDAPPFDFLPARPAINVPPEVWAGSDAPVIDKFNAQPGIVTQTTPEQDRFIIQRNEDERARELGMNPYAARKARAEAEETAVRFSGQREFSQLVMGGATPEEALRRTADKLFFNHPDKLAMALDRIPAPSTVPGQINATPIMGVNGERIGYGVYGSGGKLHSTQLNSTTVKPPAEVVAQQHVARGQMDSARREVEQARKDLAKASDDVEKQDAARRQLAAQNKLADLEKAFVVGSTNWMSPQATMPKSTNVLSRAQAIDFLRKTNGDRAKAEKLARDAGFTF